LSNEDNAFLPLSSGQISLLCEFFQSNKALCQATEKTLKQHAWVSSPLQVRPSLMFNCGIRVEAWKLSGAVHERHATNLFFPQPPVQLFEVGVLRGHVTLLSGIHRLNEIGNFDYLVYTFGS